MKYARGFTVVEIIVVIAIIVLLATVTTVAFTQVQLQARDSERTAHGRIIKSALEKYRQANGEYPSSCPQGEYNVATKTCSSTPLGIFFLSGNSPINPSITQSGLASIMKNDAKDIADPLALPNVIFGQPGDSSSGGRFFYLYIGDMTNNQASTVTGVRPFQLSINGVTCEYAVTIGSKQQTSFVFAYYGETDKKIHLITGDSGAQPTIPAGQPCVIDSV